jgi:methyl-accepting chemotaxis protein
MTASKADQELTVLLTKLYGMQEDVGAKPKTSEEEKKNKAENIQSMGKGRKGKKTGSRFLELKSSIVERLQTIHRLLEEDAARGKGSVAQGNNPKEVIAAQARMREEIRQASDEWKEMDALYKNEARKKRSKFTREELEVQETLVTRLQAEIEKCKAAQMKGYARGGRDDVAASLNTAALSALDSDTLFASNQGGTGGRSGGSRNKWGDNSSGVAMTDGQRQKLQMVQDRDAEFDQQIDEIGEGIQDLAEIAQMQSEEVQRQNAMLEQVSDRVDNVNEHVQNVNAKMKDKLNEVGRSGDKLCVDIMCILVAVGIAAVLYNMIKNQ